MRRDRPNRSAFSRDDRGSVAVHLAVMMAVLIGFAALAIEGGYLLLKHRQMQSAADGAAMSAATALGFGYPADFRMEAKAVAAAGGFTDGVAGTKVIVNSPPLTGSAAGNTYAVEVIVRQSQTLSLVRVFRSGVFDVGARSVAVAQGGFAYCLLALDPSASGAIAISNNAIITNPKCGVASNSGSASALTLSNNSAVNGPVHIHGDWSLANNAALNGTPLISHAPIIADPYAGVALQPLPACTGQSGTVAVGQTVSLTAGRFCNGFDFANGTTVNLAPGAYYVDATFALQNNVTINAKAGVTLILTGTYAIAWGTGLHLNLVAPTGGPYAGIALFGNRNAPDSVEHVFANNAYLDIEGAIYFPNQIVTFQNNGVTGTSRCAQVIARIVNISNNVSMNNDCAGTGVKPIGGGLSQLTE